MWLLGSPFLFSPLPTSMVLGNHVVLWQALGKVGRAKFISCHLLTSPKGGCGAGLGSPGTPAAIWEAGLRLSPPPAPRCAVPS